MIQNLVIVESPAKAKTIEKYLGKDFTVKSSFGHIRDLEKKDFGIDIENNFTPKYIVPADKKKVVSELKKLAKGCKKVWLASDEDREGEAIAWHLKEELKLTADNTERIVFNEITKNAILNAVKNPRKIDENLVNAQQARRVLDRIVGFQVSPILWKKVKPGLSAGRVQSVAVKLIVERERDIKSFTAESSFRVVANFITQDDKGVNTVLKAELNKRFKTQAEVEAFLTQCKSSTFSISDIQTKPGKKSPAAPFTTSTLQQEASRKLGYSVTQTMRLAQNLYEAGRITYMRTDSVNLSSLALNTAKSVITEFAGEEYVKTRNFSTKSKGAQEAHEAIRPTFLDQREIDAEPRQQRLYDLIWKRTVASQMADAKLEKTTATIQISGNELKFVAQGEVLIFDGFLKLYIESTDDEEEGNSSIDILLPPLKTGQELERDTITATERFTQKPPRYTEASLVRKLEELGIGRPSTYAPTISTIQNREYVVKEEREGVERKYAELILEGDELNIAEKTEITGKEKNKLFPTDIGQVVNDFLDENFVKIMNYNFTATIEEEFDSIAAGELEWTTSLDRFYKEFRPVVEHTEQHSERKVGERILGTDTKTGRQISVRIGRFGPMVQMGTAEEEEKPQFAGLKKGQQMDDITLEDALELFKLPRTVGEYEDKVVVIGLGRFGPYVRHDSKFVSIPKEEDPLELTLERSIELIEEKRKKDKENTIQLFDEEPELQVLNGRWGPFIKYKKKNYKIPKDKDAALLTLEECKDLIENPIGNKRGAAKKTSTKKATAETETKAKKTTTKKAAAKKTTAKKSTTKTTTAKKTTKKK